MEEEKLLPCPFCGSNPITNVDFCKSESAGYGTQIWLFAAVKCPECKIQKGISFKGTDVPFEYYREAFHQARLAWNQRKYWV